VSDSHVIHRRPARARLSLPLVRHAHLKPYEDLLRSIGAPVERYLERVRLPVRHEATTEYVSNRGYFQFVGLAAREQGIADLGYQACLHVGRTRLRRQLVERMEQSPTLYRALEVFCGDLHADATQIRVGLVERPDCILFWQRSAPEAGDVGWDISEQLVISIVIDIVRLFAGKGWSPSMIRSRAPFHTTESSEHLPDTEVQPGAECLVIPIPLALLHLAPVRTREATRKPLHLLDYPEDLASALREVMKGHLRCGTACLEVAAEIVGTSPRTLQRHLKACGTSFSDILSESRYQVAAQLLADPKLQAIDIAYAAGYSDPANFTRAFRRLAGVTPTQYRRRLAGAK
jgi:AraC-like DNA-binding protein